MSSSDHDWNGDPTAVPSIAKESQATIQRHARFRREINSKSGTGCQIRSRLFHKLGIVHSAPSTYSPKMTPSRLRLRSSSCSSFESASTLDTACSSASACCPAVRKKPSIYRNLLERSVTTHQPLKPAAVSHPRSRMLGIFYSTKPQHQPQYHCDEFPPDMAGLDQQLGIQMAVPTADEHEKPTSVRFDPNVTVTSIPSRKQYSNRIRKFLWNDRKELSFNARRNAVEFAADSWDWREATEEEGMYFDLQNQEFIHPVHVDENSLSPIY